MGGVNIRWRLEDPEIFVPATSPELLGAANPWTALHQQLLYWRCGVFPLGLASDPCSLEAESAYVPVNENIFATRVCSMHFAIPAVQVVDAPFDATCDAPSTGSVGDICFVNVTVRNKLWSSERIGLSVEIDDDFLITGPTIKMIEVMSIHLHLF